jgi:hypothetical protein
MAISLKDHNNGYFGYMSQDVKDALAELQDVTQHMHSSMVYNPNGDIGMHSLTVLNNMRVVGELEVSSGKIVMDHTQLPIYADNAAALADGLEVGHVYATAAGALMITHL